MLGHHEGYPIRYHGRVCVMCVKFLLQDVHQFGPSQLSDMSNRSSHGYQHVVNGWRIGMEELDLNYYNYCIATIDCSSTGCKHKVCFI
jgi:hypothetical protein